MAFCGRCTLIQRLAPEAAGESCKPCCEGEPGPDTGLTPAVRVLQDPWTGQPGCNEPGGVGTGDQTSPLFHTRRRLQGGDWAGQVFEMASPTASTRGPIRQLGVDLAIIANPLPQTAHGAPGLLSLDACGAVGESHWGALPCRDMNASA